MKNKGGSHSGRPRLTSNVLNQGCVDKLNSQKRSENMRRIRSRHTGPEIAIRRLVHSLGFRFRLHSSQLPGKPDLVFASRKKVIYVHGCFWHMHSTCREGRVPSSRTEYWKPKLERTVQRDAGHLKEIKRMGWRALVIWECNLRKLDRVERRIRRFLES